MMHATILPGRTYSKPGYSAAHYIRLGAVSVPTRQNLCGADLTDRDLRVRDFKSTRGWALSQPLPPHERRPPPMR